MKIASLLVLLAATPLVHARQQVTISGAGPPGASIGPQLNQPPTIVSSVGAEVQVDRGAPLELRIRVVDPEGDPVTLLLENPPPRLPFLEARGVPSPYEDDLLWIPRYFGTHTLTFVAFDAAHVTQPTRLSVRVVVGSPSRILTGDVTGDGVPDLVAPALYADVQGVKGAGALYVWASGSPPTSAPTAVLLAPSPAQKDFLPSTQEFNGGIATWIESAMQLADVTGDGILDVVAVASRADLSGIVDAGAVFVFAGGPSLTGTVPASATLTRATPIAGDALGTSGAQVLVCADVDADGIEDVLCACPTLSVGGKQKAGGVLVWRGGAGLSGSVAAVELVQATPAPQEFVGLSEPGLILVDLTGDGHRDVVAASSKTRVDDMSAEGSILVWAGGPGFGATTTPTATLRRTTPYTGDEFGQWNTFVDLDRDGVLDVLAFVSANGSAETDSGALVWRGGAALLGAVTPSAELRVDGALFSGWIPNFGVVDVTGDGLLDVVLAVSRATVDGEADAGAVYVWSGAAGWSGVRDPDAALTRTEPAQGDQLGMLHFAQLDKDRILDVVSGSGLIDVAGVQDAGEAYVWRGGASLLTAQEPWATLRASDPASVSEFGWDRTFGDVTGDGRVDLVWADRHHMLLWDGAELTPGVRVESTKLIPPLPNANAILRSVELLDLDGDGTRDVLAAGAAYYAAGELSHGLLLWRGRSEWADDTPVDASLTSGEPEDLDEYVAFRIADIDGDGRRDVLAVSPWAHSEAEQYAGVVFVWSGEKGFDALTLPSLELFDPHARTGDGLGATFSPPTVLTLRDLDGDGRLDVLASSSWADANGVLDAGALHQWRGPILFSAPTVIRSNPAAAPKDRLGT